MPATFETQAKEIAALAGGIAPIAARARVLLAEKDFTLAAHLAEWAARASPRDRDAQVLKRDVYQARLEAEANFMAEGVFRAAMNDARAALGEECLMRPGQAAL